MGSKSVSFFLRNRFVVCSSYVSECVTSDGATRDAPAVVGVALRHRRRQDLRHRGETWAGPHERYARVRIAKDEAVIPIQVIGIQHR